MSTDWHLYCVDCKEHHRFDDANHRDQAILLLVKHADVISALAELFAETDNEAELKLGYGGNYGTIDPKHPCRLKAGHDGEHSRNPPLVIG